MAERIATLLAAERQLLQDVTHELRSPLARLRFSVELARSAENREAALDRVRKDVGRLAVLVDELLQLTRAEGDPAAKAVEMISLEPLIASVVEDCAIESHVKSCTIEFRTIGRGASLLGDSDLLHRALENVLRNAVRHAPDMTTVEVSLRASESEAIISIRDHGEGVPDEALGAIFEPFFRVESDRSRSSGGVGLGLAIARRAVALHHGTVSARNAGPGLCVEITLPVAGKDGSI
jgi:two-component system sensor histidine kinase CpxA